jgi:hypothetical protein
LGFCDDDVVYSGMYGQRLITGVCVNSSGVPVEYVNIGIMNTRWSTTTDVKGHFALSIPDSLRGASLTFSHLSFWPYSVPVRTVEDSLAADIRKMVRIVLIDYSHPLDAVVVTSLRSQWTGMRNRNSRGISAPLLSFTLFRRPSKLMNAAESKRMEQQGIQAGVLLRLRQETFLQELELNHIYSQFDTLIFRVVVYRKDSDGYTPLMKSPHYVSVPRNRSVKIKVDLSQYEIRTQGTVYVGVESVDIRGKGFVSAKAYRGGSGYHINMATGEEWPAEPGFGFGFVGQGSVLN